MDHLSFPVSIAVDPERLALSHDLVRIVPGGQEQLAYSLILPKGWVNEPELGVQKFTIGGLAKIGLFADAAQAPVSVVQVFFTRFPFEVSLRDWIALEAAKTGTKLSYLEHRQFAHGAGVDAGGIYGPPGNEQVVRIVAFSDAARIFLVSAMTSRARYSEESNNLAIATHSFHLLRGTGSPQLEQWLASSGGHPEFQVAYPATWTSRPVQGGPAGKSAVDLLLPQGEQLVAYLRVKASDPAVAGEISVQESLKIAEAELGEAGVVLTEAWRPDDDPDLRRVANLTGIYTAMGQMRNRPCEIRTGIVRRKTLWFSATLISVRKIDSEVLWMRSKRAYEIALATASPA